MDTERSSRALRTASLGALLVGVIITAIVATPLHALAQATPTLTASVEGTGREGGTVAFGFHAEHDQGYGALRALQVTMLLHDLILAQITYNQDFDTISVRGGVLIRIGSTGRAEGSFFRVSGLDVSTRAAGTDLDVTIHAEVRADLPEDAILRFTATDEGGRAASVDRPAPAVAAPPAPQEEGLSWRNLALAVLVALFAGGFVGNLFASKRRSKAPVSVYGAIARQIERDRQPK